MLFALAALDDGSACTDPNADPNAAVRGLAFIATRDQGHLVIVSDQTGSTAVGDTLYVELTFEGSVPDRVDVFCGLCLPNTFFCFYMLIGFVQIHAPKEHTLLILDIN